MIFTILGSGTSHGIPVIACNCAVCNSTDERDKRLRAAALVENEWGGETFRILIDVGPDFREQALRAKITSLDLILLTHGHADHLHGLDDIRIFSHTKVPKNYGIFDGIDCDKNNSDKKDAGENAPPEGIHIYANAQTQEIVRTHFDYIFMETQIGGGKPRIKLLDAATLTEKNPLKIGGMEIIAIPMLHGKLDSTGYLISTYDREGVKHSAAYLTDCNFISEQSAELIKRNAGILEHAVIDGLRKKVHTTHFSFEQALAFAEKIEPRHTWTTHITHNHSHEEIKAYFKEILPAYPKLQKIVLEGGSVEPACDNLRLSVNC